MRIPSGDLAPVRRGRRRSRALPFAFVLGVAAAGAGGAYALQQRDEPAPVDSALAQAACPQPAAPAPAPEVGAPADLPRPGDVRFPLLNGTDRDGLAKRTGNRLAARSFVVTRTGNPPSPLDGPSRVYYGPGALPEAALLVAQVEGALLVARPKAEKGKLELVLGSEFRRLNSPEQAEAVLAGPLPVPPSRAPEPPPLPAGCS